MTYRPKKLTIRLSEQEKIHIRQQAELAGLRLEPYCRMVLMAGLHKAPLNQVGPEGVADFLAIRKSIGYAVPDNQPLYNTETYAGYKLGKSGK